MIYVPLVVRSFLSPFAKFSDPKPIPRGVGRTGKRKLSAKDVFISLYDAKIKAA